MTRHDGDGVLRIGHGRRPVVVFPSAERDRYEWQQHGMVDAVRGLIDDGRVTLYCVDSWDSGTWWDEWLPREERARRPTSVGCSSACRATASSQRASRWAPT